MYTQNRGKKIADRIKWEEDYSEEVRNFNLMAYLFEQRGENK